MLPDLPLEIQFLILEAADWLQQPVLSRVCRIWKTFIDASPVVFQNRYYNEGSLVNYHKVVGYRHGFFRSPGLLSNRVPCILHRDAEGNITGSSPESEDLEYFNEDRIYRLPFIGRPDYHGKNGIDLNVLLNFIGESWPGENISDSREKKSGGCTMTPIDTVQCFLLKSADAVDRLGWVMDTSLYRCTYQYFTVHVANDGDGTALSRCAGTARYGLDMWVDAEGPYQREISPLSDED
ncbi:hypothetical protein TWF281_004525 [Arthrobotrys megalospora]